MVWGCMSSKLLTKEERERILKTLEVDMEFRYAVAGLIGLDEILKRLDRHEEELKRFREDFNRAIQLFEKRFEEINKRFEEINRRFEEIDGRFEDVNKRFEEINRRFEEIDKRFDVVEENLDKMNTRLSRVERTLEKLTLDIEEEARSIIRYRLRNELGIDIELASLHLPDVEINIYGCKDDICVVGEASVRAGANILSELLNKVEDLKKRYPDKLKSKTILVIYASLAMPELIGEAKKHGVWVLKATEDYYKPDLAKIIFS